MTLVLVQGPQQEVVDLAAAKRAMHVDTAADDERVANLIAAATERLDGRDGLLGRALMPQTWRLELEAWGSFVRLPLPPTIAVTAVEYLDEQGVLQTLAADQYRVVDGGRQGDTIVPALQVTWPGLVTGYPDAVRVTFDCGYQDLQSPSNNPVPHPIREAIVAMAQAWYDDDSNRDVPDLVYSLIGPYRVGRL